MEKKPQNLQNHAKVDPVFHWFLAPVGLLLVIAAFVHLYRHPGRPEAAVAVAAVWALVALFKIRLYAMKVQDRVIRLEERLRMQQLLSPALAGRIGELSEGQLIALRFASDAELPGLVEKSLSGNLEPKAIKQAIQNWRPDYWRV